MRACLQQSLQSKTWRQQTNHFPQTAAKYTLPTSNHTSVCKGEEEEKSNWWKTPSNVKTFMKRPHSPLLPRRPSGQLITEFILREVSQKNKCMAWNTKYSSRPQKRGCGGFELWKLQKQVKSRCSQSWHRMNSGLQSCSWCYDSSDKIQRAKKRIPPPLKLYMYHSWSHINSFYLLRTTTINRCKNYRQGFFLFRKGRYLGCRSVLSLLKLRWESTLKWRAPQTSPRYIYTYLQNFLIWENTRRVEAWTHHPFCECLSKSTSNTI